MSTQVVTLTSYENTQKKFFDSDKEEEWRKQNLYGNKKIAEANEINMCEICCESLKTGAGVTILTTTIGGALIGTCIEPGGGTIVGGLVGAAVGIGLVVTHKILKKKKASQEKKQEEKQIKTSSLEVFRSSHVGKNESNFRSHS